MKKNHYTIILLTLILSTTYILGIDYYDKKDSTLSQLYKAISLPDFTYDTISISLSGVKTGKVTTLAEFVEKGAEAITAFSHKEDCSRLCTQLHENEAQTYFSEEGGQIEVGVTEEKQKSNYKLKFKTSKKAPTTSQYCFELRSQGNLDQLEGWWQASHKLYEEWGIKAKEHISFEGSFKEQLTKEEEQALAQLIIKQLKGELGTSYSSIERPDMMTYYGYTKLYKGYIQESFNKRSNIQISFIYNEATNETRYLIAFPFYNESF